jgi:hypothetical protein
MTNDNNYQDILKNRQSLAVFLRQMRKFDRKFCDMMVGGDDFTLRLEVRGSKGELVHCRVSEDAYDRPPGVGNKIDQERGEKKSPLSLDRNTIQ